MLKQAFNSHMDPDIFVNNVFSKKSNIDPFVIVTEIIDGYAKLKTITPVFILYLQKMILKSPELLKESFEVFKNEQIIGFLHFLKKSIDQLEEFFSYSNENSPICTFKMLKAVVMNNDMEFLKIISSMPFFSVIISKFRAENPNELSSIVDPIQSMLPKTENPPCLMYPESLFLHSLGNSGEPAHFLYTRTESLYPLLLNISTLTGVPSLFLFLNPRTACKLSTILVTEYLSSPSFVLGYTITSLIPNFLQGSLQKTPSTENISSMLNQFRSMDHVNEQHISYDADNHYFLFRSTLFDSVFTIFTSLPERFAIDKVIEQVFQNPTLTYRFIDEYLSLLSTETISQASLVSNQLIKHLYDIIYLLLLQQKFISFIYKLIIFTSNISDRTHFDVFWYLTISLIRITWGFGSKDINTQILNLIKSMENNAITYMLLLIIHEENISYTPPKTAKTPFYECIHVYQKLIDGSLEVQGVIQRIASRAYLWPSLLIYVLNNPSSYIQSWPKPYQSPINDLYFYHLMIKVSNPVSPWIAAISNPDIYFSSLYQPYDISEINSSLINQFDSLVGVLPLCHEVISNICIIWNIWSNIFTMQTLTKSIIKQLIWKTAHMSTPVDVNNLFITVAFVLSILANFKGGCYNDILAAIEIIVHDDVENNIAAEALAHFSIAIVISSHEMWKECFSRLISICIRIADSERTCVSLTKLSFAMIVIQQSIMIKQLFLEIPNDILRVLWKSKNYPTLVEYYLRRAYEKKDLS